MKSEDRLSPLQRDRLGYKPTIPDILQRGCKVVSDKSSLGRIPAGIQDHFPALLGLPQYFSSKTLVAQGGHGQTAANRGPAASQGLKIGIILSGGQAPGGHNVITGVLDHLDEHHPGSTLYGFLNGPKGIVQQDHIVVDRGLAAPYRNQGGFDMLGSGRDKIESAADLAAAASTAQAMGLHGLIVCGGDDSNTNAAVLAEYFLQKGLETKVVGVPKTIDGDLKSEAIATSFGFDTACKVYSELIGNIEVDSLSARKYYHFIRLMGRAASHITLECALQTHPQAAFICEEVEAKGQGLQELVHMIADVVCQRAQEGKMYGVFLLPEGLIEHIKEMKVLIEELNHLLSHSLPSMPHAANGQSAEEPYDPDPEAVLQKLTPVSQQIFRALPASICGDLLRERDPHGNVQVARIETERLLVLMAEKELAQRAKAGSFKGKFSALTHYMGYEGRCAMPSNFDATYCYALGHAAAVLLAAGQTGVMARIGDLQKPAAQWSVGGHPLVAMMGLELRKGKFKPVITKALVDLKGPAFRQYAAHRDHWAKTDSFRSPGPIQFQGCVADLANFTLDLELHHGQPISLS